jgi:hypothetical protein
MNRSILCNIGGRSGITVVFRVFERRRATRRTSNSLALSALYVDVAGNVRGGVGFGLGWVGLVGLGWVGGIGLPMLWWLTGRAVLELLQLHGAAS